MGDKEILLEKLVRLDHTGLIPQLHERLIACGLKFKGPKNSRTLLYYVRDRNKKEVGLAALRVESLPIFSLPKTYWIPRYLEVNAALATLPASSIVDPEEGVSSSQFSMRQISISKDTIVEIERLITELVGKHAQAAGVA